MATPCEPGCKCACKGRAATECFCHRKVLPDLSPQIGEVRVTSATGGEKGSKEARFDLIPVGPLTQLAKLYGRGAEKYAARNWERGYDWSLSYAAAQRHMTQFWAGEDFDEEMGLPHPVAAMFHMMALTQFLDTHPDFDDRPGAEGRRETMAEFARLFPQVDEPQRWLPKPRFCDRTDD